MRRFEPVRNARIRQAAAAVALGSRCGPSDQGPRCSGDCRHC